MADFETCIAISDLVELLDRIESILRREYSLESEIVSKFTRSVCTSGVYCDGREMMRSIAMNGSEIVIPGVDERLLNRSLWSDLKAWRCSVSDPSEANRRETRSVKRLAVERPPASSCCLHNFSYASRGELQPRMIWKFSSSTVMWRAVSAAML